MSEFTKVERRLIIFLSSIPSEIKNYEHSEYTGQYPNYPVHGCNLFTTPMFRIFRKKCNTYYDIYATRLPDDVVPGEARKTGLTYVKNSGGIRFLFQGKTAIHWFPLPLRPELVKEASARETTKVFMQHMKCENSCNGSFAFSNTDYTNCKKALLLIG
jgi:hypothetical protein